MLEFNAHSKLSAIGTSRQGSLRQNLELLSGECLITETIEGSRWDAVDFFSQDPTCYLPLATCRKNKLSLGVN